MSGQSPFSLFLRKEKGGIHGTPRLESAHVLKIFTLKEKRTAGDFIEAMAGHDGGAVNIPHDTLVRVFNRIFCDHKIHFTFSSIGFRLPSPKSPFGMPIWRNPSNLSSLPNPKNSLASSKLVMPPVLK